MKQTKKYSRAKEILQFPHQTQEQLYSELNRLGWYWMPKIQKWERDDTPADEETNLIKVRVWASKTKVKQAAELFIESAQANGLIFVEQSDPYQCRPPKQKEYRIYIIFQDIPEDN